MSNLQSEYSPALADSSHAFLRFKALPSTVERIVAARGLHRVPDSFYWGSNVEPPEWWATPTGANIVRYGGEFENRDCGWEAEVLIFDKLTNTVYYHYICIN